MKHNPVIIELNKETKAELDNLIKTTDMDINDLLLALIRENQFYKTRLNELENELHELRICQEKSIEAFAIGDAISDGIYMVDKQGVIIAINKVFMELTGVKSREDIIGKHVSILVKEKYMDKEVCRIALAKKKNVSEMCVLIRTNKKVLVTSNPFFNEQGEITKVLTVMRDITELIKLKEKLESSKQITKRYYTELEYLRKQQYNMIGLIGDSPSMQKVKELIYQVAKVDSTVLIVGETGVGKEIVANEIHKNSSRRDGPYIKVNCAAIPENLLESELFGYEKGAFTGALNKDKIGFFEMANKGTILLDEIGELPLHLQSKLLRVLQEKEITRIGGTRSIKLNVRVIAATNRNLEEMVNKGTFREDLYYRLNVLPIVIPPLRTRREDIAKLVLHFLEKYNEKYGADKHIDISALNLLEQYDWPGNVRELENLIERLIVIVDDDVISQKHIKNIIESKKNASLSLQKMNLTLKETVRIVEKEIIEEALKKYGSTHKAARALGVSQPTLLRKARMLSIPTNKQK
ncbi:sigma-54 interaction domain-containing protein [Moorella sulfitireducens]|uniref:sigma-54 interaction domain-containing protein n=1 Tax=Neomoorella sulfitireducens TaxID=2972948 RepID=UPI0021AC5F35|nr:sigma 54-interacting transcriptional regulator [Moorella sulfitireducens]